MKLLKKQRHLMHFAILITTLFFLFLTLTSGIYRHDMAIEKYLALGKEERFNCVGQVLRMDDGVWKAGASCVQIDSVTLLSAAHVFIRELKKDTVVDINGQKWKTYIQKGIYKESEDNFRFLILNTIVKARTITFHPTYMTQKNCDLAVIKLELPVRGLKNIPLYTGTDELGDTVTGVGFGASGPANRPDLVNGYNLKIAGMNSIDSIGGPTFNGQGSILYADFDAPDKRNGCNRMGGADPLELEYCTGGGDSGGPLFTHKKGEMYLVGITSGGGVNPTDRMKNGYYCKVIGWTRISTFIQWINETN